MDVNGEVKRLLKFKKFFFFFFFFLGGVVGGLGQVGLGGGQGGWEQRSEACVKIQKKNWGGVGSGGGGVRVGGVRVDVNGEVKLL